MQTSSNIDKAIAIGGGEVVEGAGQRGQILTDGLAARSKRQENSKVLALLTISCTAKADKTFRGRDTGSVGKGTRQRTGTPPFLLSIERNRINISIEDLLSTFGGRYIREVATSGHQNAVVRH